MITIIFDVIFTDVSEELASSISRVEK
jgi:hypothetical protein